MMTSSRKGVYRVSPLGRQSSDSKIEQPEWIVKNLRQPAKEDPAGICDAQISSRTSHSRFRVGENHRVSLRDNDVDLFHLFLAF